jgi:hypothetical protein
VLTTRFSLYPCSDFYGAALRTTYSIGMR